MQFNFIALLTLVTSTIAVPTLSTRHLGPVRKTQLTSLIDIRVDMDSLEQAKMKRNEAQAAGSSLEDIEIAAWYDWD